MYECNLEIGEWWWWWWWLGEGVWEVQRLLHLSLAVEAVVMAISGAMMNSVCDKGC